MLSPRDISRLASVFLFGTGIMCLSSNWKPGNPYKLTSLFSMLAYDGVFTRVGIALGVAGFLLFVVSYIPLPGRRR